MNQNRNGRANEDILRFERDPERILLLSLSNEEVFCSREEQIHYDQNERNVMPNKID